MVVGSAVSWTGYPLSSEPQLHNFQETVSGLFLSPPPAPTALCCMQGCSVSVDQGICMYVCHPPTVLEHMHMCVRLNYSTHSQGSSQFSAPSSAPSNGIC